MVKNIISGIGVLSAILGIYVFFSGNQNINDVKKDNSHIKYLKDVNSLELIEYINSLPKELKIIETVYNNDEHLSYIKELDFLKNVWLKLTKFYQEEYFGDKGSKEFLKDYIEKKEEIFYAKYRGFGKEGDMMVTKRVVYEVFNLIEDLVNNISYKNQKIDYLNWKDKWEEAIGMKYLELSVKEDELYNSLEDEY